MNADQLFFQGMGLHQAGHPAEAIQVYKRVLSLMPVHIDALHLIGVACAQLGNQLEPVDWLKKTTALDPNFGLAYLNLGVAQQRLGQLEAALANLNRAVVLDKRSGSAFFNRGCVLLGLAKPLDALTDFDKSIALEPTHAGAHDNRGNALFQLKRYEEAIASHRRAIELSPDFTQAYNNLGLALLKANRASEALPQLDRAIALLPQYAEAHDNRGVVLQELMRCKEAIASHEQAIALKPDLAMAYNNLGIALETERRFDEALLQYEKSITIQPDDAATHGNIGRCLSRFNRQQEALNHLQKALDIDPRNLVALHGMGCVLMDLSRYAEAKDYFDHAIAVDPKFEATYWSKFNLHLLSGDWSEGWALHEWRWQLQDANLRPRTFPGKQLWMGEVSLKGKTVVLTSEQGLGDVLQFCRYAHCVSDLGAEVLLQVPLELKSILQDLDGVAQVYALEDLLPDFDFHCPLMSLPHALSTSASDIPLAQGYLKAKPLQLAKWEAILGPKRHPRVGLVWSGNPKHDNDLNRSLALSQIWPQLAGVHELISLQKVIRQTDAATLKDSPIKDLSSDIHDFEDTAALCQLMDVVISVDTSVAHLSGALGVPTWVLLPFVPDWRWQLERTDSPWYTSVRLYRQPHRGDWASVLAQVANDLQGL